MTIEERREQRLKLLDDHIGRSLADAERNGELRSAPSFGKPLDFGDGYDETPAELRMPFKMLKDSGFLPPEISLMREIETLRGTLAQVPADAPDNDVTCSTRQRLAELQQQLAMRMEKLSGSRSL